MSDDDGVIGNEPLVDGMNISVRIRRDFRVTDAARLLAAARRICARVHPEWTEAEVAVHVSGAADVVFLLFEEAGLLEPDAAIDEWAAMGLSRGGWAASVTPDEPSPLMHPAPRCGVVYGSRDPFATSRQDS